MRNVRAGGVDLVGVGHVIARRAWVGARQLHLQSGSAGRPRGTGPALGHIDVRHSRMAGRPGRQATTWPYRGKSLTAQHLLSIRGYLSILVEVCDVRMPAVVFALVIIQGSCLQLEPLNLGPLTPFALGSLPRARSH